MGEHTSYILDRIDMMYTRASASDYDDWKTIHENPGWGSDELIPLLRRVSYVSLVADSGTVLLFLPIFGSVACVADGHLVARRRRRTKLPMVGQPTAQTARSRSLELCLSILEINTCKLQPHLIPLVLGHRLTQIQTISKPLMCMLWDISNPAALCFYTLIHEIICSDGPSSYLLHASMRSMH